MASCVLVRLIWIALMELIYDVLGVLKLSIVCIVLVKVFILVYLSNFILKITIKELGIKDIGYLLLILVKVDWARRWVDLIGEGINRYKC